MVPFSSKGEAGALPGWEGEQQQMEQEGTGELIPAIYVQ